jgi:hypothetical protein
MADVAEAGADLLGLGAPGGDAGRVFRMSCEPCLDRLVACNSPST